MENKQKGNTLVVSLILLLIFSILGLASIKNVSFNQKMSGKFRDSDLAFNIAEAVLKEGEAYAESLSLVIKTDNFDSQCTGDKCFSSECEKGLCFHGTYSEGNFCLLNEPSTPPASDRNLWENPEQYRESQLSFPEASEKPRYIVEFLCYVAADVDAENPPERNENYPITDWAHFFRITSYAVGVDSNSNAILQSTYKVIRE